MENAMQYDQHVRAWRGEAVWLQYPIPVALRAGCFPPGDYVVEWANETFGMADNGALVSAGYTEERREITIPERRKRS